MQTRAKFKCVRIERTTMNRVKPGTDREYELVEVRTIILSPVYGNGDPEHENTKFWLASPSGEIKLGVVNASAAAIFDLEKEYYVDFTPANAPAQMEAA